MDQPNYVLFITDQQRFDNLGCYGHPVLQTPNIDQMADEGVVFDRFYVASPVCMPNRASLMTCRLPSSHGVRSLGIPLAHQNVTFVELLRSAGYDTALIGKSHIQNVTDWPTQFEPKKYRDGFRAPPKNLKQAVKIDLDEPSYHYEQERFWGKDNPVVPKPFYGFDDYISVLRHGANSGGDFEIWLKENAPEMILFHGHTEQFAHDYICPQAIRTKLPEKFYSTSFIADQASQWIEKRKDSKKPFFLMVSFPDPHHPFTPPGKYWDMYRPEEMPIPHAFEVNDWDPPEYVKIAEKDRAKDKFLGKKAGYSLAVSKQEALEARALTGGMISMIDDAVGKVRDALVASQLETKTVQIYTSDHGDHLGDHRLLFKGAEQYDTITHVPFIWADPQGKKGGRSSDLAQTLDIGTTILEHAKVEATEGMQGQVMSVAGGAAREVAFIQYDNQRTQEAFGKEPRVHTIIHRQYRLSVYRGICENELFDLEVDPNEMNNLWDDKDYSSIKHELIQKLVEIEIDAIDRVPLPTAQG